MNSEFKIAMGEKIKKHSNFVGENCKIRKKLHSYYSLSLLVCLKSLHKTFNGPDLLGQIQIKGQCGLC